MAESADSNPLSQGNEISNYVLLSSSEKCYSKCVIDSLNNSYKSKLDSLNNSYKKKLDSLNEQHTRDSIVCKFTIDTLQLQHKKNLLENQNHEMSDMWDTIVSQGKQIEKYERIINEFRITKPEKANLIDHKETIRVLQIDTSALNKKVDSLSKQLQKLVESPKEKVVEHSGKENNSIISQENVPYVCGLLAVLIIAITIISLKRGLTFSKGNTSICIGEKKKTRTKKAD